MPTIFGVNVNINGNQNGISTSVTLPGLPGLILSPAQAAQQPSSGGSAPTNSSFNINNFIQNLNQHGETARTDKFDILLVPPAAVASYAGISPAAAAKGFNLQCEMSELPGRDIQMTEYMTHAFTRRVPHLNQYGAHSFTFICTGDFWEKQFFDAWVDMMIPAQTGLVNYPLDPNNNRQYECDIYCNQYDLTGSPIYQAQLIDAVPINVAPLSQSWDNDSVHRLTVTFAYRKWLTPAMTFNTTTTFTGANPSVLPNASSGQVSTSPTAPSTGTLTAPIST
jgi:hypothetical protein